MSISLFEGVPVDEVAAALAGLEHRRFGAGSTVLFEGDYPGERRGGANAVGHPSLSATQRGISACEGATGAVVTGGEMLGVSSVLVGVRKLGRGL